MNSIVMITDILHSVRLNLEVLRNIGPSVLLLSETFLILRTERDIIMYVGLRIK
jgi:hypothetical protein